MTIKAGDRIPDVTFTTMGENGPQPIKSADYFKGRKVVLFSVPGAFTPTCHKTHLPGFVAKVDAIKARGVDKVAVVAVNDAFVLDAWLEASHAKDKVDGLADGSANFAKETGTELDLGAAGLGLRSKRYAALIDDGVVKWIDIEDNSSCATVSSAESALGKL
jgi:glutaredoxin/glutathione-dependent peroxiredoxin